jgi:hypothetical protein
LGISDDNREREDTNDFGHVGQCITSERVA